MSLRVSLYAEGSGDTGGNDTRGLMAPGNVLAEETLGAAHLLVRRSLYKTHRLPEGAVQFLEPLRVGRGRIPKGSDLLHRDNLRQLLSWPRPDRRPNLAVILVDADGELTRRRQLQDYVTDLPLPNVIAVPVQEFESWLVADQKALNKVLQFAPDALPNIEGLSARHAKSVLSDWTARMKRPIEPRQARRELADHSDLDVIEKSCPAFRDFLGDLSMRRA